MKYQVAIGLEIHAELKTHTKIFCSCPTSFGAPPNTLCCPTCMGHPGTLPTLNRRAVELCLRAGLALGCSPAMHSRMDRKHYFYPDLPKGYQISQNEMPLCESGALTFFVNGVEKTVGIRRIHIEEDAGKLIHRDGETWIDHNRCGVPLIEVVTDPTMETGAEASAFLKTLRDALVALGVSDCKMQEGGMRCDVNVSLYLPGASDLGVRTEIKNLNSFSFVEKAIRYEIGRQAALLERGEQVTTETMRYDEATGRTHPMRHKERSVDYCYLPEPNLPAFYITDEEIEAIRQTLPALPHVQARQLAERYSISLQDASLLTGDQSLSAYFVAAADQSAYPGTVANLLILTLLPLCPEDASVVDPKRLSRLADLCGEGKINHATAKELLIRLTKSDFDPVAVIEAEGLAQLRDAEAILAIIKTVTEADPRAVADYRGGKTAAANRLLGGVIRASGGKADPNLCRNLLLEYLEHN